MNKIEMRIALLGESPRRGDSGYKKIGAKQQQKQREEFLY